MDKIKLKGMIEMIKLGQVYISKVNNIEQTVIAIDGQNENDRVVLKFYTPSYGITYVSYTVKDIKQHCILKEETKWQSMN